MPSTTLSGLASDPGDRGRGIGEGPAVGPGSQSCRAASQASCMRVHTLAISISARTLRCTVRTLIRKWAAIASSVSRGQQQRQQLLVFG